MKWLMVLIFIPIMTHAFGGDGTRGGGDTCEISFKVHVESALRWLGNSTTPLTAKERARVQPLLGRTGAGFELLTSERLKFQCVDGDVTVNGVPKTAATESKDGGKHFFTEIKVNRWMASSELERLILATHEVLVMAGVESTGDQHVSETLYSAKAWPIPVAAVECDSKDRDNSKLLTVRLSRNPNSQAKEVLLDPVVTFEIRKLPSCLDLNPTECENQPRFLDRVKSASPDIRYSHQIQKVSCSFGRRYPRLFSCLSTDARRAPIVTSEMGIDVWKKEAFKMTLNLSSLPGLRDWLHVNAGGTPIAEANIAERYDYFSIQPLFSDEAQTSLHITHQLDDSPTETLDKPHLLPMVQRCVFMPAEN